MIRILLGGLASAALLVLPATAQGDSTSALRVRGTVASKSATTHLVSVHSKRTSVALRVPGSLAAIHVGQRVELRGTTLRAHGRGSRVLARGVAIVSSQAPTTSSPGDDDETENDEVELKGVLASLSPPTVHAGTRTVSCAVPTGVSLAGFAIGDVVEITCDLRAGEWVLRKLEHEDDDDENEADEDHGGNSGPGSVDDGDDEDDDHGSSGPGGGGDD